MKQECCITYSSGKLSNLKQNKIIKQTMNKRYRKYGEISRGCIGEIARFF
jgi:hypothetical protein